MWPTKKICTGEYHKIPDFKHETGRPGSWQPAIWHFSFSSPSGLNLLKICKTFLTSCYKSADFCICLSLWTEAEVFAGFQKGFQSYLTIQTCRQQKAGQSPYRPARAPAPSLRWLKQWTSTDFSSNQCPWKTHLLPVTVHALLYLKQQLCEPYTHTNTHTLFPKWHSGARGGHYRG